MIQVIEDGDGDGDAVYSGNAVTAIPWDISKD